MDNNLKANEIFIKQALEVIEHFPSLRLITDGDIHIEGEIEISDESGRIWETFLVVIRPSEAFPYRFPLLFEVGGKIPRIPDWHINSDGSCCVDVEPSELIYCKNGITIVQYLIEKVNPFLSNQAYRIEEGCYANGEYPHGDEGIFRYYFTLLRAHNYPEVLQLLAYIIKNERPSRVSNCFCGSGKKFRHCHRDAFDKIKLIDKEHLIQHFRKIETLFKQILNQMNSGNSS